MSSPNEDNAHTLSNNLVETAVEFLTNAKIINQPEQQKISFLKKKGLDDEQISVALNRVQSMGPINDTVSSRFAPALPPQVLATPRSTWDKVRDTTNTIICISGMFFGCKYIYKYYIGPYLTGIYPKSERDAIIEVQQSMMSVLVQIQNTLEKMDKTIDLHGNTLKKSGFDESSQFSRTLTELKDVKMEVTALKGLLINRQNFPVPPTPSVSIPQWQSIRKKSLEKIESGLNSNSGAIPKTNGIHISCEDSLEIDEQKNVVDADDKESSCQDETSSQNLSHVEQDQNSSPIDCR